MHMALYNSALWMASPFITRLLDKRLAAGKEDAARFDERLGLSSRPRPEGQLVWLHAASVGEAVSALSLIAALLKGHEDRSFLVTTGTRTSAEIMRRRLPERAFHQYIPVDKALYVRRFLDHWQPDLAIWMESEIWPNLIWETSRRHVPMMLVNARITEKSYDLWRKSFGFSRKLLGAFDYCSAQNEVSAERLQNLGARQVEYLGNLKFAANPLPLDEQKRTELDGQISGRKVWLAASTHPGEESIVIDAHKILRQVMPDLLTIIVPRHPERGAEVLSALEGEDIVGALRSISQDITAETGVYVADTIGELGLFYRSCGIVFIGGSLVEKGGQNPIEAAQLDCAILQGPHIENFSEVIAVFKDGDAIVEVRDTAELATSVATYLASPQKRDTMAKRAAAVVARGDTILSRLTDRIEQMLKEAGHESP